MKTKKILRKNLIDLRLKMSKEQRLISSRLISTSLLNLIIKKEGPIGFYWPIRGEYDPRQVIVEWLSINKKNQACLPVIKKKNSAMIFREWTSDTSLTKDKLGVLAPDDKSKLVVPTIVIVPTVGFDSKNNRLGYGGGYYDRTLCEIKALKIGVCFNLGRINELDREPHDIELDLIISG